MSLTSIDFRGRSRSLTLLVKRELKMRYKGSFLGYAWTILDPLLLAFIYWLVFGLLMRSRTGGSDPYLVFLLAGLLPWRWFTGTLTNGSRAFKRDTKLLKSAGLPRYMWVLRTVVAEWVEYLLSLPVLIFFIVILAAKPSLIHLPYFLLGMAIQFVLALGLVLMLAPARILVPDVKNVIANVTRLGFYASPVIYGLPVVPEQLRWVFYANPMAGILELNRYWIFPEQFIGWAPVAVSALAALVMLVLGWWVFRRLEGQVLKEM